jgi:RNA polymerase sigma-70 factor, ECF subfamily
MTTLDLAFTANKKLLWGLCYRMTGCAADADELVQETFIRALEKPPPNQDEPWKPWLITVALNVSRDLLRKRKRSRYIGPWLPSPIEDSLDLPSSQKSQEALFDLAESASFAFLLALEALTPLQRAALLLRDVFEYPVKEAAQVLLVSENALKAAHFRARSALSRYLDKKAVQVPPKMHQQTLEQFFFSLANGDLAAIEKLLRDDVVMINDGGGEFFAARVPVHGNKKVALFFSKLAVQRATTRAELRRCNGMLVLLGEFVCHHPQEAPKGVISIEIDSQGQIAAVYSVVASRKLTGISW